MNRIKMLVLLSAMMLVTGSAWSAELVGYWSFDENQGTVAGNSANSAYNGVITGATWAAGKVGSALKFNGSTDYVEIADTAANSPYALTSMSMSAWIRPDEYPTSETLLQWDGIVGHRYWSQSIYGLRLGPDGGIYFVVYGPFGQGGAVTHFEYGDKNKHTVYLYEWHHVAVTYDNSNVKFYIDGKLDSVYPETRLPTYNNQSLFIGSGYNGGLHYKGLIDEVKIYNGALTDAEVEAEYRRGWSQPLSQSYFDKSYYTSESTANLEGKLNINGEMPSSLSVKVALLSQGVTVSENTVSISSPNFSVPISVSSISAGYYDAQVSVLQNGSTLYTEDLSLLKYPSANWEVKADKKNLCMQIDDSSFFPIGITSIPDMTIPEYAEAGFNITTEATPDTAYYNGMMVSASGYYCVPRSYYTSMTPEELENELRTNGNLSGIVNKYGNHPAFAGYFWDEPAAEETGGAEVLSDVTRDLDPYHPIMPTFYQSTGPTIPPGLYDLYISDLYWYNAPTSTRFGRYNQIQSCARLAANDIRKPFWFMPESAGWDAQSAITPAEQRIQTYLALIYGARGIFYWSHAQIFPAMRTMLKQLAGEIRDLSPILLTKSPDQTVTGVASTGVHALAKMYNGACYLLTANNSINTEKTVRIQVSSAAGATSANVLFENRTVPVSGGILEDYFAPYATHVYILQDADQTQPVAITLEKLASSTVTVPGTRRWPDVDTLYEEVGNPGFEDQESGQPRLWNASCGWETSQYCSLDTSVFNTGTRSLKLSIPQVTRYSSQTGFGWTTESAVTAFDLGALRTTCRWGHTVANAQFKVDLPNGNYTVVAETNTANLFEMKGGNQQSLTINTVDIPVSQGIVNNIKLNTFDVTVDNGQFILYIPSGVIYSLTFTPKSGGSIQAFDFGSGDRQVTTGRNLVSASETATVEVSTHNRAWTPQIELADDGTYTISAAMKSDTPGLPVSFGMQMWQNKYGSTVNVGTTWARYSIPVTVKGSWVYVEINTPGTVWVDDFELVKN